MTLRVGEHEGLDAVRWTREHPAEAAQQTRGFQRLAPSERQAVLAMIDSQGTGFDQSLVGLLGSNEFNGVEDRHRSAIITALAERPSEAQIDRLRILAGDDGFQFTQSREALEQARDVVRGTAFPSVDDILRDSGVQGPSRPEAPGLAQLAELGLHALEAVETEAGLAEALAVIVGTDAAAVAAGALPAAAGVLSIGLLLHEIAEAHAAGADKRDAVNFGRDFVRQLDELTQGEDGMVVRGRERASGALSAQLFWTTMLTPAQRVEMQTMENRQDFVDALSRVIERITMRGHDR